MTPAKERVLQERCIAFKKIHGTNRLYMILQYVLDGLVVISLGTGLMFGRSFLPTLPILLILVKMAAVLLLKGKKGNFTGLAISAAYLPLLAAVKALDTATGSLAVLILAVHIFRIAPCSADEKVRVLYGAPGFNGFLLANELKSDENFAKTVLDSYNRVSRENSVNSSMTEAMMPTVMRCMKPVGILALAVGAGMLFSANEIKSDLRRAKTFEITPDTVGRTVTQMTDKIYCQTGVGAVCTYRCRLDGQCVNVNVYDERSQADFRKLYYAGGTVTEAEAEAVENGRYEISDKPIRFTAEVKKYDAKDPLRPAKKTKDHINDDVEIVDDYYLDVIDPTATDRRTKFGIGLAALGTVLSGAFYTVFLMSRNKHEML